MADKVEKVGIAQYHMDVIENCGISLQRKTQLFQNSLHTDLGTIYLFIICGILKKYKAYITYYQITYYQISLTLSYTFIFEMVATSVLVVNNKSTCALRPESVSYLTFIHY